MMRERPLPLAQFRAWAVPCSSKAGVTQPVLARVACRKANRGEVRTRAGHSVRRWRATSTAVHALQHAAAPAFQGRRSPFEHRASHGASRTLAPRVRPHKAAAGAPNIRQQAAPSAECKPPPVAGRSSARPRWDIRARPRIPRRTAWAGNLEMPQVSEHSAPETVLSTLKVRQERFSRAGHKAGSKPSDRGHRP